MCVLSIKVPIRKKSGNLLCAPYTSSIKATRNCRFFKNFHCIFGVKSLFFNFQKFLNIAVRFFNFCERKKWIWLLNHNFYLTDEIPIETFFFFVFLSESCWLLYYILKINFFPTGHSPSDLKLQSLLLRVFHISVNWWFSAGVWVIASLLMSWGLFSVFWPISTML